MLYRSKLMLEEEAETLVCHCTMLPNPTHGPINTTPIVQKPSSRLFPGLTYTFAFVYPSPVIGSRSLKHETGGKSLPSANSYPLSSPICHIPPCPLITARCFSTASFASKNLSTQFRIQGSSFLSKLLDEMPPVTHFFQQMSVSSWTAGSEERR